MAYTALYREWRPKSFEDVVGQEHITTTLKNQILNDRIAHAYLFCGTRGTGKTSTAKVFAKALNCLNVQDGEPCNTCEMCDKINKGIAIDVVEMDAASNNGVDKIREIVDDVKYPPQESRFKVYIMDEVHMLSTGAVNAFLKTLEEPPANVIFILATTDPQKLPITILSRCQRFDFKRIRNNEISERLRKIVTVQGVLADDKSLDLIARVSDGAMRDSLSILDQAISMGDGKVEYDELISMLGLVTNEYLFEITSAIVERNVEKSMGTIEKIVFAGKDVFLFIKDLTTHFRNLLMAKVTNNPEEVLDMSFENIDLLKEQAGRIRVEEIMRSIRILQEAEASAKLSKQARLYLELAIIKMCKIEYDSSNEVILARINRLEEGIKSGRVQVAAPVQVAGQGVQGNVQTQRTTGTQGQVKQKMSQAKAESVVTKEEVFENTNSSVTLNDVQRSWKDALESFKARRAMIIYASIVTGKPISCANGVITIEYAEQYAFNKNRLEKTDNTKIINEVFSEILKEPVRVKFIIDSNETSSGPNPEDLLRSVIGNDDLDVFDE